MVGNLKKKDSSKCYIGSLKMIQKLCGNCGIYSMLLARPMSLSWSSLLVGTLATIQVRNIFFDTDIGRIKIQRLPILLVLTVTMHNLAILLVGRHGPDIVSASSMVEVRQDIDQSLETMGSIGKSSLVTQKARCCIKQLLSLFDTLGDIHEFLTAKNLTDKCK